MRAVCTWGDGPDVLLALEGTPVVLYEEPTHRQTWKHGIAGHGSLDLTAADARKLALQLYQAADQAEQLDRSLADQMALDERDRHEEVTP